VLPDDPDPRTSSLGFATLGELRQLLSKDLTRAELVETLLGRIARLDRAGPQLRSVLAVDGRAAERAEAAEAAEAAAPGLAARPLLGVPVLVKDNLDTAGGLGTTAGSLALAEVPPARDATAVARLREAGAVVLGKTNLSEWANFRSRRSSSGWSAVGGQTRNPHALDRSPGGSSSGSGAAVAAGFAPLAVGTETDGSILCPAAVCGVVGVKPTRGLVSRAGVVPIAASQDSVGPMARSVVDAALLLGVLAGADLADPATLERPAGLPAEYTQFCRAGGLEGMRVGVPRAFYTGYHPAADRVVAEALRAMHEAGATLIDPVEVPTAAELDESEDELTVFFHEFHDGLDRYLAGRPGDRDACPRSLAELIAFNEANAGEELALFGQDLFEAAAATEGLDAPGYRQALERNLRRAGRDGLDAALDGAGLDALVVLTMAPAWCIDQVNGDPSLRAGYQAAAVAGYPSISLPVGSVDGLPVGLTFLGRAWSEPTLLRLASALEHQLDLTLLASFRPSVALR